MVLPPVDHECSLQKVVYDLAERLAKLEHENDRLKKTLYGKRTERSKMPRVGGRANDTRASAGDA